MEPQESSQADKGEQEAPCLPEVRYTGFRGTQGGYESRAGKWMKHVQFCVILPLNIPHITHPAA